MHQRVRRFKWLAAMLAAGALLTTFASPAQASLTATKLVTLSFWDWNRSWSGWRSLVIFPAAAVLLWLWCFHFVFLHRYLRRRKPPLWPLEGFYRALGWFVFLLCAAFVLVFAGVGDELWLGKDYNNWYPFPVPLNWLNQNMLWILILLAGAAVGFLIAYVTRHPTPRSAAQQTD